MAEQEDQLTTSEPLPSEWLVNGAQDDTSSSRRKAGINLLQSKSFQDNSVSLSHSKIEVESEVLQNIQVQDVVNNLMLGKKPAPVLFKHECRSEMHKIERNRVESLKLTLEEEDLKERSPNALWCFSVHVVSGHHLRRTIPAYVFENLHDLTWQYQFNLFGETIKRKCTSSFDQEDSEVLKFCSLSKHYFLGDVAAIENMFAGLDPIKIELKLLDTQNVAARSSNIQMRSKVGVHDSLTLFEIPDDCSYAQCYNGTLSANDLHSQRLLLVDFSSSFFTITSLF